MTKAVINLAAIAEGINAKQIEAEAAHRSALERTMEAGKLLIEAKKQLPYGQWLPWIEEHCQVSAEMAGKWMKLAREWPRLQEAYPEWVPESGVKDALRLLAKPRKKPQTDAAAPLTAIAITIEAPPPAPGSDRATAPAPLTLEWGLLPPTLAAHPAPLQPTDPGQTDLEPTDPAEVAPSVDDLLSHLETLLGQMDRPRRLEELERMECRVNDILMPYFSRTTLKDLGRTFDGVPTESLRAEIEAFVFMFGKRIEQTNLGEAIETDLANLFTRRQKAHGWQPGLPLTAGQTLLTFAESDLEE